ncbi:MAG TPA: GspH/FimT family pseudopilin [Longimicrobiaceae bacterium]
MTPFFAPVRSRQGGFTLLEILVVLTVILLATTIAAPRLNGVIAGQGTRGAIDQLTADITLARTYAVREGFPASVKITSATTYQVTVDTSAAAPKVVKTVRLQDDYAGVQLTPATGQLTFNTRGLLRTQEFTRVKATRGTARDSVQISSIGRTYRDY